ncbi:DNA cytosine methyltransferase [Spirosoma sordidisoli]|uniref:DNA cytosine methyltransferase n=1 Tax=Spirosoma sordidisoli TaxID=2502893 RepID=A0A4Q2UQZ9_9BACT|nr:DNA cytosine methyltransferase [Spirosoma sordidisoli]RYC70095.1 DNA cytosine methyltransferase [Spirosoma sordidisoli]
MSKPILISLFDQSGSWSNPYRNAGYDIIQIDLQLGTDVFSWDYSQIDRNQVVGILAAPPCTEFAALGAKWWKKKDPKLLAESIKLVDKTLEIICHFSQGQQFKFWVIENPVGRLDKCIPALKGKRLLSFQPCEFGDPYTKRTILWGHFSPWLVRNHRKPVMGSKMHRLYGGKSERTKRLRSITPSGFADAFFQANNPAKL